MLRRRQTSRCPSYKRDADIKQRIPGISRFVSLDDPIRASTEQHAVMEASGASPPQRIGHHPTSTFPYPQPGKDSFLPIPFFDRK
jgi:hypothetical protein